MSAERLVPPEEVAEMLSVSPAWVQKQARAGVLPGMKLGRYWRFKVSEVEAWLTARSKSEYKRRS